MAASGTRTQKIIMQQIEEFKASQAKLKIHSSPKSQQLQPLLQQHGVVSVSGASGNAQPSIGQPIWAQDRAELGLTRPEQHDQASHPIQQLHPFEAKPVHSPPISTSISNGAPVQAPAALSTEPPSAPANPAKHASVRLDASDSAQHLATAPSLLSSPTPHMSLAALQESSSQHSQPAPQQQQPPQQHLQAPQQPPQPAQLQQQAPEPARPLDPVRALQELRQATQAAGFTLEDGWTAIKVVRKDGKSKGGTDIYFISPAGKKLKSQSQVFKFLQIPAGDALQAFTAAPAASHSSPHNAAASEGTSHPAASQGPASIPTTDAGLEQEAQMQHTAPAVPCLSSAVPGDTGQGVKRPAPDAPAPLHQDKKHCSIPDEPAAHPPVPVKCGSCLGTLSFQTWRITCECQDCSGKAEGQRSFSGPQWEAHGGHAHNRKWRSQSVRVVGGVPANAIDDDQVGMTVNDYCQRHRISLPAPRARAVISPSPKGCPALSIQQPDQKLPQQSSNSLPSAGLPMPTGVPNGIQNSANLRCQSSPRQAPVYQPQPQSQPSTSQPAAARPSQVPLQNGFSVPHRGQLSGGIPSHSQTHQIFQPGPMQASTAGLTERVQHLEGELVATQAQVRLLLDGMTTLRAIFRAAGSTFEELMPSMPQ
ncbi:hypothetical protein WJX74_004990 [Apatococcus lobatus]|uniref:MBD domain-containing protein n=1 Tax=Apatococcus lobatus TaxID=904363 RepID=A0AAW1RS26_9CHLO